MDCRVRKSGVLAMLTLVLVAASGSDDGSIDCEALPRPAWVESILCLAEDIAVYKSKKLHKANKWT